MTTATTIGLTLLFACACAAQANKTTALACNLNTISSAERPRCKQLVQRVRASVRERQEVSDGYIFTLEGASITLPEAAEWVGLELRCCPFLTIALSASGRQADWALTLTGPEGVKQILDAEFPAPE